MKFLILIALAISASLHINSEEMTKKEKEDQIVEMVKKYVEQKASSSEYIISCDKAVASKKLLATLEKPLTIEWDGKTIKEVAEDLRVFMDINIVIHRTVSREDLVDFKVKDMKAINVIKWILRTNNLNGVIIEGVLMIAPPEKIPDMGLIMLTYDINDLTNTIKDFPASDAGLNGKLDGK
jgi:hypothetical protein